MKVKSFEEKIFDRIKKLKKLDLYSEYMIELRKKDSLDLRAANKILLDPLYYSTKSSTYSRSMERITDVIGRAKKRRPDIKIDGELQFDAAVIPEVAKSKGGNSEVAGQANVLIFPNLDSANICVKVVNRLARTLYYGIIIQGAPIPFNDLSRGSPPIEILKLSFLTLMQLKMQEKN